LFILTDSPTNQWSEGGNSDLLINLEFLSLAGLVAVSASLISIVRRFLVKQKLRVSAEKNRLVL